MHPTLFSIHSGSVQLEIASYSFFMVVAILFVVYGSYYRARKMKLPNKNVLIALCVLSVSILIGARMLYVLSNFHYYRGDTLAIFRIDFSGFSLFGGIILAIISGLLLHKLAIIDMWIFGDIVTPFLGIGLALLRIGCFLNGCCFGVETTLPWGVRFPLLSDAHRYQLGHGSADFFTVHPVHPTQVYELVAAIAAVAVACYIHKKGNPSGTTFLVFGTLFTGFRFVNHFLRVPPVHYDASPYLFPGIFTLLFLMGVAALCMRLFLYNRVQH